jgi:MFS family permease
VHIAAAKPWIAQIFRVIKLPAQEKTAMRDGPVDKPRPMNRLNDPMVIAVVTLGFTQIISWGTTLYALGVLGKPIARDTGWSQTLVFGGLTLGLLISGAVSTWIGREIDQRGARLVMTAGSMLVAASLAIIALPSGQVGYLIGWAMLGLAMRMTLYDAAFAALVQVTPTRGRLAISYLTLFGGLASTVFWPIGYALEGAFGWRVTIMIFAAINLVACLPLHWFGLARRDPVLNGAQAKVAEATAAAAYGAPLEGRSRVRAMLLFGFVMAASAATYGAMAAHLVPVLASTGIGMVAAVTLASIKGVAQTLARLVDLVFGRNMHPIMLGRLTLAFLPLSFLVLLLGGASYKTALAFTLLFGVANGLTTIVRGAVPLAIFGTKGYGEVLGILATPYLIMNALAPMVFALITEQFGIQAGVVILLGIGAVAWISMEVMAAWYRRQGSKR